MAKLTFMNRMRRMKKWNHVYTHGGETHD
jgi:hypothetical protein